MLAELLGYYVLAAIITAVGFALLVGWVEYREECRERG